MDIDDTIIKTIEIIVKSVLQNAPFDRTISAIIEKQSGDNEYKYKYQGSIGTALSLNKIVYKEGDNVYILIPANDNGQGKIILGKVQGG